MLLNLYLVGILHLATAALDYYWAFDFIVNFGFDFEFLPNTDLVWLLMPSHVNNNMLSLSVDKSKYRVGIIR